MGRVTRAAARADPVLADETCTVAGVALSEDPAEIALPPSPEKASDRPPLGEIRGNDKSTADASSQPANLELVDTSDGNSSALTGEATTSSENENLVVLVLGEDVKAAADGKKSGKKSGKGAGIVKKSTKKANGKVNEPSPQVIEQLRQTLKENVKTLKGRRMKKEVEEAGNNFLDADDEIVSSSDASSEASDMLKEEATPGKHRRTQYGSLSRASEPAASLTLESLCFGTICLRN